MQRGVGSIRVTSGGTRFVSPSGSGRLAHPLARERARTTPRVPVAARVAAERDLLGAVRRSARSPRIDRRDRPPGRAVIATGMVRWARARRWLGAPRSWCSPPRSR